MPNTLAHIAVNGIASRYLGVSAEPKWIYAGVVVPDLPWILNRLVGGQAFGLDPIEFRSYCIILSSFLFCLLMSIAASSLSSRPRSAFAALALGSFFHLLLDAMQTKWGNGVSFFGPLDWVITNFGLFWPESLPTYILTATGLFFFFVTLIRVPRPEPIMPTASPIRGTILGVSLLLYFLSPLAMLEGPIASDAHFLDTVRNGSDRIGKPIELDRTPCVVEGSVATAHLLTHEPVALLGLDGDCRGNISVKGTFVSTDSIAISASHFHNASLRDCASLVGLSLILLLWLTDIYRNVRLRYQRPSQAKSRLASNCRFNAKR